MKNAGGKMSKGLKRSFVTSIVLLVVVGVTLIVAASWAWYSINSKEEVDMTLSADGVVLLNFSTSIIVTPEGGKLSPAVEVPGSIENNAVFSDVLHTSAIISRAASTVSYTTDLDVYVEAEEGAAKSKNFFFGLNGEIITNTNDKYVIEQQHLRNILGYSLQMKIEPVLSEEEEEHEPATQADPPAGDGFVDVPLSSPTDSRPVLIEQSSKIYFRITLWLSQPQGLLDPTIFDSDLNVYLNVTTREN